MQIANTQELFIHELADVYDAEHRFIEGQQEMVQKATDEDLKGAISQHIEQTREHAANVERVFRDLGVEPWRESCEAAQGLVSEAQEVIGGAQTDALRDVAIASAVAKVEHYEIGSYRTLVTGAQLMGRSEAEQLLRNNLDQEEQTARIAEGSSEKLLRKARQEGGQEEEEGLIDKAKEKLSGG